MNEDEVKVATTKMINGDPFCPVRLTRVENRGRATDKFMVEVQKEDGTEWIEIPGVKGVHSANYRLVTNRQVHDLGQAVMERTGMTFKPVPSFGGGHSKNLTWNGAAYVERWYAPEVKVKSPQGTDVLLGVEVRNSYDNSCKVGLAFFGMHMVCSNQFFSRNLFGTPFNFTHIGNEGQLDDEFDDAFANLQSKAEQFGQIAPALDALMHTRLDTLDEFLDLRRRMNEQSGLTFRDREILDELSGIGVTKRIGAVTSGYGAYGDPATYWALANAVTAITTHLVGGLRGQDQSERAVDFLIAAARDKRG